MQLGLGTFLQKVHTRAHEMNTMTRREFSKTFITLGAATTLSPALASAGLAKAPAVRTSVAGRVLRIEEATYSIAEYPTRTPLKFGGSVVNRLAVLDVRCVVRAPDGRTATGLGSMTLGNAWSFPSPKLTYDQTLDAMKALTVKVARIANGFKEYGHPLDLNAGLEPAWLKAAPETSAELNLGEPIPKLCTLVVASPFDAALHDGFGKLHQRSAYKTYDREFLPNELSHYLGEDYKGRRLNSYLSRKPKRDMPMFHLIGAADALTEADLKHRLDDGLPETLPEWIDFNGLTHLKIKLNGDNLDWDIQRFTAIERVASAAQKKRGVKRWVYSLDFNEKCRHVDYLLAFIGKLKESVPQGFGRIQYIEQPTARDLAADRQNVMHKASKLVPIVIDESLTDLEMLMLAREMGYTGVALKTCKGQSNALLMAAAAQFHKMFLCVQDLTCPGASLIQSAGLAAHIPAVPAIEANARQFIPAANKEWEGRFPGIFDIKNGHMRTGVLTGWGLGAG